MARNVSICHEITLTKNETLILGLKKRLKKALKVLLPLLLGGAIFVWTYADFDFSEVNDIVINRMNVWWILFSLVFGVFSHLLRGWRWKLSLAPLDAHPKTSNCVNAVFVSYAANLLIPRIGEVSRCGILAKYDGVSFSKSLGTVVTERLIDTLCVGLIMGFTLLFQMGVFNRFFATTGTSVEDVTALFTSTHFYIILVCVIGVLVLFYFLLRTLSFFEKVKGVVLNVWEGILSLKHVEKKWLFFLYTFLIWFSYFMQFYVSFFSFDFSRDLGLLAGLVMFVVGSIAVVVPTPNGAGPWHFAVITMMMLYGISKSDAGVFALLVHGIQTFLIILLGIYGTIALSFTNKKKQHV